MSSFLEQRKKLNLTQEELAEKANVSVRTIQRIEAGQHPKGYTLDSMSKALGISKDDLLKEESEKINRQLIKYINLSSILLMMLPFGSIIIPIIIMRWKKEINSVTKQIVSIQILWTLSFIIIVLLVAFLSKWLSFSKEIIPLTMLILMIVNLYIIIRNTLEIEKSRKLHIYLKFSFL
jgi:transcriptional regulator with XRE-family HTH domain